jgi:hypothetical protein
MADELSADSHTVRLLDSVTRHWNPDNASGSLGSARAIRIPTKPVIGQDEIFNHDVCSGGLVQRFSSNLRIQIAQNTSRYLNEALIYWVVSFPRKREPC